MTICVILFSTHEEEKMFYMAYCHFLHVQCKEILYDSNNYYYTGNDDVMWYNVVYTAKGNNTGDSSHVVLWKP